MNAAAITSQVQQAGFPLTLELKNSELLKPSWVKISQIRTLSIRRLREKLGSISAEQVNLVVRGLNEIIGE